MSEFRLPRLSAAVLRWLLADRWETALGDFHEYYASRAAEVGPGRAANEFRLQVLGMIPSRIARKVSQAGLMFRNYVTLSWRHLRKNRTVSAINVFGLSVAVACCITVFLFLDGYLNMNREQPNGDRIFVAQEVVLADGEEEVWGTSPLPLGAALAAELPQIESMARTTGRSATVFAGGQQFDEWVTFAEPAFTEIFEFEWASGRGSLRPDEVLLGHRAASRFFGQDDPIGQELPLRLEDGTVLSLTVAGVAAPLPASSGVRFEVLANLSRAGLDVDDWTGDARATVLLARSAEARAAIAARLDHWAEVHNQASPDDPVARFGLENLANPEPGAWQVRNRFFDAPHPVFVIMLLAIPVFMLALSCFNYINISLGAASNRLREIGIRKVIGGSRKQLILQFMAENLLLCAFAMGIGAVASFSLMIPMFNSIFVNQIVFRPGDVGGLVGFLALLLVVVAVISGAYPALYISAFRPVQILRGRLHLRGNRWLTRALLTAQFVLAFATVILSLYLTLNGRYITSREWGYDPSDIVTLRVDAPQTMSALEDYLRSLPQVEAFSSTLDHVGSTQNRLEIEFDGRTRDVPQYRVTPGYLETVGLTLIEGSDLQGQDGVLVNRSFVEAAGWGDATGATVRLGDAARPVVGVLEDFHIWFAVDQVPVIFTAAGDESRFLVVRSTPGASAEVAQSLETFWEARFPDQAFEVSRQAEIYDAQFESYRNVVQAFSYLAGLALVIACLGLFGLASQTIARRLKEVSIRKVLGANVPHLALIVNRAFLVMLTIAGLIATGVTVAGYSLLMAQVETEVIHLPVGPGLFLAAFALVLTTAGVAVSSQARMLIRAEPASVLRSD